MDEDFNYFEGKSLKTAERVARRALVLVAVGNRGLIENELDSLESPQLACEGMIRWIEELGIGDEVEPEEWRALQRGVGRLEEQAKRDCAWRLEGCAVLLWALGRLELPSYDRLVEPSALFEATGWFDVAEAPNFLASPQLKPRGRLAAYHKNAIMTHWRLRNYCIRPHAIDFVAYSKGCWIGTFDLAPFEIINNDLALRGRAIADADPGLVGMCRSIAIERHHAMNWLMGECERYADVKTNT